MQVGDRFFDEDGELIVTNVNGSLVEYRRKGASLELSVGLEWAEKNWKLLSSAKPKVESKVKQTEMITLRVDKATYLDMRKKVMESGLSFNSWILSQLGYEVQTTQKPRGRRPSKFPEELGGRDGEAKS